MLCRMKLSGVWPTLGTNSQDISTHLHLIFCEFPQVVVQYYQNTFFFNIK